MSRPRKDSDSTSTSTLQCIRCKKSYKDSEFYSSSMVSQVFSNMNKIPICKNCIQDIYKYYYDYYESKQYHNSEKMAIKRLCMILDLYYSDNIFDAAVENTEIKKTTLLRSFLRLAMLTQNRTKNYDHTLGIENPNNNIESYNDIKDSRKVKPKTVKFFGTGFDEDDYIFLQEQYDDWTTRHECNTKTQEEIFKQICFTQLELLKTTRAKQDTKDLTATFQKLLETAKLQPKQNHSDAVSDSQTFGTLIDKWENTRPLPDIDEELKDVDKIGLYIDTFFKGHLAKMMGLKNGFSNLYNRFMKKYTVEKPEYKDDENSEALFDAIFGNQDI